MTLIELIRNIADQGYRLSGDIGALGLPRLPQALVIVAPMCLIPAEPPVEKDVLMIPDVLKWDQYLARGWPALAGYARIEGAATTNVAVVHLQFIGRDRQ